MSDKKKKREVLESNSKFLVYQEFERDQINIRYSTCFDVAEKPRAYRRFLNKDEDTNAFVRSCGDQITIHDCNRSITLDFYLEQDIYGYAAHTKTEAKKEINKFSRGVAKEVADLREKIQKLKNAISLVEERILQHERASQFAAASAKQKIDELKPGEKKKLVISNNSILRRENYDAEMKKAINKLDTTVSFD